MEDEKMQWCRNFKCINIGKQIAIDKDGSLSLCKLKEITINADSKCSEFDIPSINLNDYDEVDDLLGNNAAEVLV